MPEPCGGGISRGVDHSSHLGAAGTGTGAGFPRQPGFGGHQGQVGHRGGQVQLAPGLDPAEIAGLAKAQLDQPGQPVFHHHSARSIFVIVSALLQRPALLQQGFLGMDHHPPPPAPLGCDALGPQWTCPTFGPVELEGLQAVDPPRAIRPLSRRHDGVGNLPRRTGATARGQVNDKVILGKALPVRTPRHPGNQSAARVGEGLSGIAITIGGVAHGLLHRHTGVGLARLHQFQRPRLSGALPGNTSTAVIS